MVICKKMSRAVRKYAFLVLIKFPPNCGLSWFANLDHTHPTVYHVSFWRDYHHWGRQRQHGRWQEHRGRWKTGRMNKAKKVRATTSRGFWNVADGTKLGNTGANTRLTVAGGVDNNTNGNVLVVGGGIANTGMSSLTIVHALYIHN